MGDFLNALFPGAKKLRCILSASLPLLTSLHLNQDQVHARQAEVAVAVGGRGWLGGAPGVSPASGKCLGDV